MAEPGLLHGQCYIVRPGRGKIHGQAHDATASSSIGPPPKKCFQGGELNPLSISRSFPPQIDRAFYPGFGCCIDQREVWDLFVWLE